MLLFLFACAPICTEETTVFLLNDLAYLRQENGLSKGFNLDNTSSNTQDPRGCYHQDFVHPDGTSGIDNNFAHAIDFLAATEAEDIEYSFNEAIRDGLLLLLLEIEGDLYSSDACLRARISYGEGPPLLSSSGQPLDGQSFSRRDISSTDWVEVHKENDDLYMQGFDIVLQSEIMTVPITLSLEQAQLHLDISESYPQGYFGGGIPFEETLILTSFDMVGMTEGLQERLGGLLDLFPDATQRCQSISTHFHFQTIPAHFYP